MHKVITLLAAVVSAAQAFAPIAPEIHVPKPYSFGYKIKDKHGEQHREETGDGVGVVKGSYGFTDERGIHRQVHYIADKAGFRAEVKTNEHGTAPLNPAAVKMISSAHPYLGGAGHVPKAAGLVKLAAEEGPMAAKFGPRAAELGLLASGPIPFGVPVEAPGLVEEGLSFGFGVSPLVGAAERYDSRFGAY